MNRRKQAILSDDEIVDVLINYIDEELYNYAVEAAFAPPSSFASFTA